MRSNRYSPTWALNCATRYFGFDGLGSEYVLDRISAKNGRDLLLDVWNREKDAMYHSPWYALRQEWFHTFHSYRRLPAFFEKIKGKDPVVLDFGCGTAEFARLDWIDEGRKTILADLPGPNRNYLYHKYPKQKISITTPKKALEKESYDALVCLDVLEHVFNPMLILGNLWDNLKPGGSALLWFDESYPHPGHLEESVLQKDLYEGWLRQVPDVIGRRDGIDWVQKPKRFWN